MGIIGRGQRWLYTLGVWPVAYLKVALVECMHCVLTCVPTGTQISSLVSDCCHLCNCCHSYVGGQRLHRVCLRWSVPVWTRTRSLAGGAPSLAPVKGSQLAREIFWILRRSVWINQTWIIKYTRDSIPGFSAKKKKKIHTHTHMYIYERNLPKKILIILYPPRDNKKHLFPPFVFYLWLYHISIKTFILYL